MMAPAPIRIVTSLGAVVVAGALGGCGGLGLSTSEPDANVAATSTNIASLTEVVQRNPNDPQAYNVRGAVLGRAAHVVGLRIVRVALDHLGERGDVGGGCSHIGVRLGRR